MSLIERLKTIPHNSIIWDKDERASVKGLFFRSLKNGEISIYLYYRTKSGLQRKPKLGDYPSISIGEARARAKAILAQVMNGIDPKGNWDLAKKEMTIDDLFTITWKSYWDKPRFHASTRAMNVNLLYQNKIKPAFGNFKLSFITPQMVRKWHRLLSDKTPTNANRALEVLGRMYSFAYQEGHLTEGRNPCEFVKKNKEAKRGRFATIEELQQVLSIIKREEEANPASAAFLYLLIFTGSRPKAIEMATWDQITMHYINGLKVGVLKFRGKSSEATGEDETVIIPPQAMEALDKLPKVKGQSITGIKNPRRLWRKIQAEIGCKDLWMRDLRRTFATTGMSTGITMSNIGEVLNHKSTQTTKIYAKLVQDSKIETTMKIANRIAEISKLKDIDILS